MTGEWRSFAAKKMEGQLWRGTGVENGAESSCCADEGLIWRCVICCSDEGLMENWGLVY